MPEPADRPPLRDQIIERAAEWAYAYPISSNAICQTDDRAWRLARIWGEQIARIAVMPVVEAETAALRQRAEEAEAAVQRSREALTRLAFGPVPTSREVLNAWRTSLNQPKETP